MTFNRFSHFHGKRENFSESILTPKRLKGIFPPWMECDGLRNPDFSEYRPSRKRYTFSRRTHFTRVPWIEWIRRSWSCFISCHRGSWRSGDASCEGAVTRTDQRRDSIFIPIVVGIARQALHESTIFDIFICSMDRLTFSQVGILYFFRGDGDVEERRGTDSRMELPKGILPNVILWWRSV